MSTTMIVKMRMWTKSWYSKKGIYIFESSVPSFFTLQVELFVMKTELKCC